MAIGKLRYSQVSPASLAASLGGIFKASDQMVRGAGTIEEALRGMHTNRQAEALGNYQATLAPILDIAQLPTNVPSNIPYLDRGQATTALMDRQQALMDNQKTLSDIALNRAKRHKALKEATTGGGLTGPQWDAQQAVANAAVTRLATEYARNSDVTSAEWKNILRDYATKNKLVLTDDILQSANSTFGSARGEAEQLFEGQVARGGQEKLLHDQQLSSLDTAITDVRNNSPLAYGFSNREYYDSLVSGNQSGSYLKDIEGITTSIYGDLNNVSEDKNYRENVRQAGNKAQEIYSKILTDAGYKDIPTLSSNALKAIIGRSNPDKTWRTGELEALAQRYAEDEILFRQYGKSFKDDMLSRITPLEQQKLRLEEDYRNFLRGQKKLARLTRKDTPEARGIPEDQWLRLYTGDDKEQRLQSIKDLIGSTAKPAFTVPKVPDLLNRNTPANNTVINTINGLPISKDKIPAYHGANPDAINQALQGNFIVLNDEQAIRIANNLMNNPMRSKADKDRARSILETYKNSMLINKLEPEDRVYLNHHLGTNLYVPKGSVGNKKRPKVNKGSN